MCGVGDEGCLCMCNFHTSGIVVSRFVYTTVMMTELSECKRWQVV